jgi:hypothetical protein
VLGANDKIPILVLLLYFSVQKFVLFKLFFIRIVGINQKIKKQKQLNHG